MEKKEQVVYVKDLLFTALYRWRLIFILAVCFAVLLGGYTAVSGLSTTKTQAPTGQTYQPGKETDVYALQQDIQRLEILLQSQQTYLRESLLINMDSSAVYSCSINLFVEADSDNPISSSAPELIYSYQQVLKNQAFAQQLAQVLDTKECYAKELVTISKPADTTKILHISIRSDSEEKTLALAEVVKKYIQEQSVLIFDTIAAHTIQLSQNDMAFGSDLSLNDLRSSAITELNETNTALKNQTKQLNAYKVVPVQTVSRSAVIKKAIILAMVGAIVGGGIGACIFWFIHLASAEVYSARTLKNCTGLNVLACVPSGEKYFCIDKLLRKWEGRHLSNEYNSIAASIVNTYCGENKRILIINNCLSKSFTELQKEMEQIGLQICVAGNPLESSNAVNKIAEYENVLLVAQCGVSRYTDTIKISSMLNDLNKHLVGCILVDG